MDKEQSIEEYFSSVRHDLRAQLAVIREDTSQILDGLGNKNCAKCFGMLKPAWEATGKMNKLIEELLSAFALEAVLKNWLGDNVKLFKSEKEGLEKSKNELINMISHTVRTPLTVIKEGLSLVLDEIPGKLNSEQKKFLVNVKKSADCLIQSVESILRIPWEKIAEPADKIFSEHK